MLIYNPAFDFHHAVFRLLQILTAAPEREYEIERLRILDYFLLFPEQIETLRFPSEIRHKRSLFQRAYNPYRQVENPQRLFFELEPFQLTALQSLAAHRLIDRDKFKEGLAQRTQEPLPAVLAGTLTARNARSPAVVDLISRDLAALPLLGPDGLKERSHLLDARYDAA